MDADSKFVLKFGPTSEWPGQYVDLDQSSGGYPYAVKSPLQAKLWDDELEALRYASSFKGDDSYKSYAIEHKVYILTASVREMSVPLDIRPHSRACGIRMHDHGRECSSNCPTCGGKSIYA